MSNSTGPHNPPLPERRTISRGTWLFGCLGVFILVVGLGVLSVFFYFRGRHQQALRAVQAEVKRIQAAGEPITTEDMVKFHRVPEGVFDATPLWLEAIRAAAETKTGNETQLPIVGEGKLADLPAAAPQSLFPLAQQFLAAHRETIDKTRQAAAAGGQCRFPIEFSAGINAKLSHAQQARELARILSLRMHVAVITGDADAAIESLELALALARTLDHEPILISQFVRMAVMGIALQDVRQLVGEVPLSEERLAGLQQRVAAIDAQQSVKSGLLGERAMGYHAFHHISQLEGMGVLAGEDGALQRPGDLRVYLDLMRETIEAADEPPAQARLSARQIEDALKARIGMQNPLDRLETVVTAQLLPATGSAFDASARMQALRDSVIAGIAFRRYQLQHGLLPDSLEAVVPRFLPAVPLDPFAAGNPPLILAVDGEQYAIYSIGVNGRDDKALLRDPESQDDTGFVAKLSVPMATLRNE